MTNQRLSAEQWSQYWRRDSITTFWRRRNENYDREFADFWNTRFALLGESARVLDVATGNGALALLAARYASLHARSFEIVGIDFAAIDPRAALATHEDLRSLLAEIRFVSHTPMEATGLPGASFDLITSQYGFEYGNLDLAAQELARLARFGGAFAAVLHHVDSAVIELARDSVAQIEYCLGQERLDERVVALVRAMGEARTPEARAALQRDSTTEALRAELNATVARINANASRYRDPEGVIGVLLPNFMNVFFAHKNRSLIERLRYVDHVRHEFSGFKARMADLHGAALSDEGFARVVGALGRCGFAVRERGLLHYGPNRDLMGWIVVADKLA